MLNRSEPCEGGHVPDEVLVERRGVVQVVTLNRPSVKNALNAAVAEVVIAANDPLAVATIKLMACAG